MLMSGVKWAWLLVCSFPPSFPDSYKIPEEIYRMWSVGGRWKPMESGG